MTTEFAWLIAVGGIIAAVWNHIQKFFSYIYFLIIEKHTIDGSAATALISIIHKEGKPSRFFRWYYNSEFMFDSKSRRKIHRPTVMLSDSNGFIKFRGNYMWMSSSSDGRPNDSIYDDEKKSNNNSDATGSSYTTISFFRGSFSIRDLLKEATDKLNIAMRGTKKGRFQVTVVTGDAGNGGNAKFKKDQEDKRSNMEKLPFEALNYCAIEPIHWQFDDLFPPENVHDYIVPKSLNSSTEKIKNWFNSEKWFVDKSIPWKMGTLLSGAPGTGKSSYVSYIAKLLDIPLFVFDLTTLKNEDLTKEWRKVASSSPAIILIEDVGAIYNGTKRTSEQADYASFDCLLNCIDGAEKHHGILLFLTTNHIDRIEPALIRSGRIDNIIELTSMTEQDRKNMIQRILGDCQTEDEICEHVKKTTTLTPSDVQSYCTEQALMLRNKLIIEKCDHV